MTQNATEATPEFIAPEATVAETSGGSTAKPEPAQTAETVDYKDKFEAQQKVNRDLERKFKEAASAAEERDALQAKLDGKEAEHAAKLAKANDRILKSEVKAAAKGVLADPQDAYKFLDLDQFEVSEDGEVEITAALEALIKTKPYLAVQDGKRFQGDADAGARNEARPAQLTRPDLERMSAQEIEKARKEGRLNDLLGIKT